MSIAEIRDSEAEHMEQAEIDRFLRGQGVGVLAVSDGNLPYVLPLSFGYDGDSRLYFAYLLFGAQSKKEELSNRVDSARFLVYTAESMTEWRSVLLTGELDEVPEAEWDAFKASMQNAWHPNLFATATPMRGISAYQLRITEQTSLKHTTKATPS